MSYESFSYYYDSLMEASFYDDYLTFINQHARFQTVLELGCGTGEIAIRLALQGKDVLATDLSQDMVMITREKAIEAGAEMQIARVDMIDFEIDEEVDCVLCLCDSLNYVLELDDVQRVFENIYRALKPSGTLIFDVDSLYKCNVILDDYHEEQDDEDYYFRWDVTSDHQGSVEHHVIIKDYLQQESVDEIHHQKTYDCSTYCRLLKEVHFSKIDVYSDFEAYHEQCERHIFVCQK